MLKIILHHVGRLSFVEGAYHSGEVIDMGGIDPDFTSVLHLYKLLRDEFGYHHVAGLWYKFDGENFERDINSLETDVDVVRII